MLFVGAVHHYRERYGVIALVYNVTLMVGTGVWNIFGLAVRSPLMHSQKLRKRIGFATFCRVCID